MTATRPITGARHCFAGAASVALLLALAGCAVPAEESWADAPDLYPPPTGQEDIEAWFAGGHYQSWVCELSSHPAIMPSPHGRVRVCANPIVRPDTPGEHPVESALVIEIRNNAGALVGHGAQLHTTAGTRGLDWYWYMKVPLDNSTPHDANGLAADGWGFEGAAADVCVACHATAGTPDHAGHDFVWVVP